MPAKLTLESVKCPKCGAELREHMWGNRYSSRTRAMLFRRVVMRGSDRLVSTERFVRCPDCGLEERQDA